MCDKWKWQRPSPSRSEGKQVKISLAPRFFSFPGEQKSTLPRKAIPAAITHSSPPPRRRPFRLPEPGRERCAGGRRARVALFLLRRRLLLRALHSVYKCRQSWSPSLRVETSEGGKGRVTIPPPEWPQEERVKLCNASPPAPRVEITVAATGCSASAATRLPYGRGTCNSGLAGC